MMKEVKSYFTELPDMLVSTATKHFLLHFLECPSLPTKHITLFIYVTQKRLSDQKWHYSESVPDFH